MGKNLIIARGIPGSGKSTFASLLETKAICCADDYHMRNGKYDWNLLNGKKAHDWCQRKCELFMKINASKIVITNTSTTEKEMLPYLELANRYGYKVFSIVVENRHGNVNIHDVPQKTLDKMVNRFNIKLI